MTRQVKLFVGVNAVLALVLVVLVVLLVTTGGDDDASSPPPPASTTASPIDPSSTSSGSPSTSPFTPPSTPPSTSATGDPGPAPAGLEKFYGQQLDWQPCTGSTECAMLTVPVDYQQPEGDTVQLKLERTLATDQADRVGSLVVNPGGPGEPGTTMAENAGSYFRPQLLAREDIVAFDPRGTGDSDPISCLSDADFDAFLAMDPTPDDAAEGRQMAQADEDFFAGCVANSDSLIGHVSTVEAAMDMDVLRSALGEPKLDYLGFSYGTELGATYADLYPDNVGRFVLDGAVDPDLSPEKAALTQAGGFETALRSYVQNCVDGGSCFLGDTLDAGLSRIKSLLDQIDQTPLPTSTGAQLTSGNAFYGVAAALYSKDTWSYLDQGLKSAIDGDGSVLMALFYAYAARNADGTYMNNSLQAFPAISCLDDPTSIGPDQVRGKIAEFEKASPTFGEVFAWGLMACRGIQVKAEYPRPKIDAPGAPPILVLGTTRDPATPFAEAQALAKDLDSGVLISRDGDGHTAYNKGNSCIDDAVEGYLLDGTVPPSGLSC